MKLEITKNKIVEVVGWLLVGVAISFIVIANYYVILELFTNHPHFKYLPTPLQVVATPLIVVGVSMLSGTVPGLVGLTLLSNIYGTENTKEKKQ